MTNPIIGWDIGGAHVKAAWLDGTGRVQKVLQTACPLWKGIQTLEQAVETLLPDLPENGLHAVTMTGELVDCFDSREHGVSAILQTLRQKLAPASIKVFAGRNGFIEVDAVTANDALDIASANWIASAILAAKRVGYGLFVDIGSTTTDILLLQDHALLATGCTDYARLVSGELLYTGVVRSSVMAVAQQAEFNGRRMGLMLEHFATMADVYRLTGDLKPEHDQSETADGAAKTLEASALRLSRLTGYDFSQTDWLLWLAFAQELKSQHLQTVRQACRRQLERAEQAQLQGMALVGAGVGRFLAEQIAPELGLEYVDFCSLFQSDVQSHGVDAADCAPAVAVAYLAGGFG